MTAHALRDVKAAIGAGTATIGIIGLGYVGLPLARATANAGFRVLGFDTDEEKLDKLLRGETYVRHVPAADFQELIRRDRFVPTGEFSRVGECDAIIICVPTPLTAHREPDLSFIVSTANAISRHVRSGQLIVLESTTYPGTTREVLKPILEREGFKSGRDFFLAFSPEREDPGNSQFSLTSVPKVVGGDGDEALNLAVTLYDRIAGKTVPVSSPEVAEAVKITENIFRAVNIAMVNELKQIFARMSIDIWEVIDAAKTKPFGFMPFYPGPGLGGHCIPIDPFYLTWKAREFEMPTRFIELAGEINASMPAVIVDRIVEELSRRFAKSLRDARILLLGLAYKKNVDDIRESPSFRIIELLERRGALVDFFDPFVSQIPVTRQYRDLAGREGVVFTPEVIRQYDAAVIVTDHDAIDYSILVDNAQLVVDTRNAVERLARRLCSPNVCKA